MQELNFGEDLANKMRTKWSVWRVITVTAFHLNIQFEVNRFAILQCHLSFDTPKTKVV